MEFGLTNPPGVLCQLWFALQQIPVAVADDVARECWIIHVCIIVTPTLIQIAGPAVQVPSYFQPLAAVDLPCVPSTLPYIAKPIRTGHRTSGAHRAVDRHL